MGGSSQTQAPERALCFGQGRGAEPCGLKASERLLWRGAGEEGKPALPLPGSRLGGRNEISQQIMKLSLIAAESEGRRGCWAAGGGGVVGVSCTGGLHRA